MAMTETEAFEMFVRQVDRILWAEWDPIGCGVPDDEYTFYARIVADKAMQGETAEQIKDYLYWAESDHMGLTCTHEDVYRRTSGIVNTILDMAAIQLHPYH